MPLFGSKRSMIQEDAERADIACGEIERLRNIIAESQGRIQYTLDDFIEKKKFYEQQINRLNDTLNFCAKLLSVSSS